MTIVGLVGFAGVVVFAALFGLMVLKGGSLKLPAIGMAAFFVLLVVAVVLIELGIGGTDDPEADSSEGPTDQVAQGSDPVGSEGILGGESQDWDTLSGVNVDSGLFNVTLTLPADYLEEGTTQEQLEAEAKENGFKSVTLNDDGSATYVMTKSQHRDMMQEIKQSIDEGLAEMAHSEEFPGIVSVEANDDYTKYKVTVDSEEVGLSESLATIGLYLFSGTYHVFNGTKPDNVNIQYINSTTGMVIQEANSSDME